MINNKEYNESVEEDFSEDVIKELVAFREQIKPEYEVLDRRDSAAVDAFLDSVLDRFGGEQNLNQQELEFVREILQEDINSRDIQEKEGGLRSVDADKEKKLNIERMKEVVQPNLESAVNNYVKFVQPFEGTRAFQEELEVFYIHQKKYLAEDLGIVNPHERDIAMEALMQLVREKSTVIDSVKRSPSETIQIQKKIAHELIERLQESYAKIAHTDTDVVEKFWSDVESDVQKIKGMRDEDLEKINDGVRKIIENIARESVNKKNESVQEQLQEKPQEKEVEQTEEEKSRENIRSLIFNGITFKGEQANQLRTLGGISLEKRKIWIAKKEQNRESKQKIATGGLKYDSKEDDLTIIALHQEYLQARENFFDKVAELSKENNKEISPADVKAMEINEGINAHEDVSDVRSEKFGDKLRNSIERVSTWLKEMPQITKRTVVATFLVAGLAVGAVASKDKDLSDSELIQGSSVSVEKVNQQALSHSAASNELLDKIVQQESSDELIEQDLPIVDKNEVFDAGDAASIFNEKLTISEDGGSIEGELIKYLAKNHEKLVEAGLRQNEGQADNDWAGFHAHRIAQDFAKKHPGYDIDMIQKGTEIIIDAHDVTQISVDINFEDGPRIVPEKMKIKKELKVDDQSAEIENLRTLLQQPEFKGVVSDQITSVFDVESVQDVKGELSKSVNDVLKGDVVLKEKIDVIEKRASKYYNNLPDKNKSMQNYFIRLCAKAHRDGLVEEIFAD